jgi:hypothetical protein
MRRTNLFKVCILYPVAFKAFYRLKVKLFTKELFIKELSIKGLPLKKPSIKDLLFTGLSITRSSDDLLKSALSHRRFAGDDI